MHLAAAAVDAKANSESKGLSSLYNPIIFPILIRDTRFLEQRPSAVALLAYS